MVVPPTGKLCTHRLHFREIHEKCAPATALIDRHEKKAVITVKIFENVEKIIFENDFFTCFRIMYLLGSNLKAILN